MLIISINTNIINKIITNTSKVGNFVLIVGFSLSDIDKKNRLDNLFNLLQLLEITYKLFLSTISLIIQPS